MPPHRVTHIRDDNMVFGALVQKYRPSYRGAFVEQRPFRAIAFLTSCASDFDVVADWIFFKSVADRGGVAVTALLLSCLVGTITWAFLASDGHLLNPLLKKCGVKNFSTGILLLLAVIVEDVPQVILTFILEQGEGAFSNLAVVNLMTAVYSIIIKLAEAYDEREDLHETGSDHSAITFEGHENWVNGVCKFTENAFVSASCDNTIKMWDTSKQNAVMTFKGHNDWVNGVCKINDNTFVSASDDKTLKMWDTSKSNAVMTLSLIHISEPTRPY